MIQEYPYKVQERAYRGKKERTGKSKRKAVNRFKEADMWCRGICVAVSVYAVDIWAGILIRMWIYAYAI